MIPLNGLVEELRRSKSEAEVERIVFAADTADKALADVRDLLVRSMNEPITERDVRDELEYRMRRHGADGPSYETIVATGPNAARPHHRPTDQLLSEGDAVVIDVGGLVDGYHSDMTRSYLLGKVDSVLQTMLDVVSEAQQRGVAAVRAGELPSEIDRICRAFITEAGFGPEFVHGTGHGVGLNIHESPWLRAQSNEPLREGEVVTVEPGVYRVGLGGVRIEDLLLVRAAGSTTLTHTPKDSLCLQSRQTI
jgi:Xaa-Pro aminopeptidase